jgi:hypothetical protein
VDGSIQATVTRFNQQQALIRGNAGAKHKAAQPAQETVAVQGVQGPRERVGFIFEADFVHGNMKTGRFMRPVPVGVAQAGCLRASTLSTLVNNSWGLKGLAM